VPEHVHAWVGAEAAGHWGDRAVVDYAYLDRNVPLRKSGCERHLGLQPTVPRRQNDRNLNTPLFHNKIRLVHLRSYRCA
jgi:hypothetical protein